MNKIVDQWIYSVEDWVTIDDKWHHIVFVIHEDKSETYVDGTKQERKIPVLQTRSK